MDPSQFHKIDELCDAFEAAWLRGERPTVEDYLARAVPDDRPALLAELLRLDAEYRGKGDELPRLPRPGQARRAGPPCRRCSQP